MSKEAGPRVLGIVADAGTRSTVIVLNIEMVVPKGAHGVLKQIDIFEALDPHHIFSLSPLVYAGVPQVWPAQAEYLVEILETYQRQGIDAKGKIKLYLDEELDLESPDLEYS